MVVIDRSTFGRDSLLVALDDLDRPQRRLLGIEAGGAPGLALMEEVVAAIELDLDLRQSLGGLRRETGTVAGRGEQLLLLGRQGVDVVEHRDIVHDDRLRYGPSHGGRLI